jgi:stress response protein SCP2
MAFHTLGINTGITPPIRIGVDGETIFNNLAVVPVGWNPISRTKDLDIDTIVIPQDINERTISDQVCYFRRKQAFQESGGLLTGLKTFAGQNYLIKLSNDDQSGSGIPGKPDEVMHVRLNDLHRTPTAILKIYAAVWSPQNYHFGNVNGFFAEVRPQRWGKVVERYDIQTGAEWNGVKIIHLCTFTKVPSGGWDLQGFGKPVIHPDDCVHYQNGVIQLARMTGWTV